jgi:hypothetical protein
MNEINGRLPLGAGIRPDLVKFSKNPIPDWDSQFESVIVRQFLDFNLFEFQLIENKVRKRFQK